MTDDHEEESLALLTEEDRDFVNRTERNYLIDPGWLTPKQAATLSNDERAYRDWQLSLWHGAFPYVDTAQVRFASLQLGTVAASDPGAAAPLRAVSLLTGPPGTGKSTILQHRAALLMKKAAQLRRIQLDRRANGLPVELEALRGVFRPVVHISLLHSVTDKQLFTMLCRALQWPAGDDPWGNFISGAAACGTQAVLIDEIQFIDFKYLASRNVHNALKSISNYGVRVVLCGHGVEAALEETRKSVAFETARDQSLGRWETIQIGRLEYGTEAERTDWADLLRQVEVRIRLSGHEPGERVLSGDLAEFLWVSTKGYLNSLSTLVTKTIELASLTKRQRLSETLFERLQVEKRSDRLRAERVALWRSGKFDWRA